MGANWLRSYVPVPQAGWGVIVQRPTAVAFASAGAFRRGLLVAIGVFLTGGLFFWLALSRRVIAPLERLADFSQAVGQPQAAGPHRAGLAELSQRADQMGHLVRSLTRMERAIQERFSELSTLLETSQAVVSTLDSQAVLERVLEQVERLMGLRVCSIVMLDPRTGMFEVRASRGLSAGYARRLRISPSEPGSPTMRAIRSGRPVLVADTETDESFVPLLVVAAGGLLFGLLMYVVAVHRVINAPHLSSLLATFSVNMMVIGVGTSVFSTNFRNVDFSLGSVHAGPVSFTATRLAAAAAAVIVAGALYYFLYRTTPGKFVRAVANNRAAAELMGIPSARVLALSFGLGTMLAAVAGGLTSTFFPFTILSGGTYELKSFVVVVLGGLGNPLGALIGGLLLGLMEGLISVYMKVSWVPVLEFALFVTILLVRPSGLLGARK